MAQLTVDIPNTSVPRVRQAFAKRYGYRAQVDNPAYNPNNATSPTNQPTIPNPVNIDEFIRRKIREHIRDIVVAQEQEDAQLAASGTIDPNLGNT